MKKSQRCEERPLEPLFSSEVERLAGQNARILEFPAQCGRCSPYRFAREGNQRTGEQSPRDRLLRALEMERRGFVEGAVALLRRLYSEETVAEDPRLAIAVRYSLASLLTLRGNSVEARTLTEDGILLAWEHSAREELELLDDLAQRLAE